MYAIMRSEKAKMSDVGGIQAEVNRSADHPIKLPGSAIDWSKTQDNEYFVRSYSLRKDIRKVLAEHGITSFRKDAVTLVDSFFGFSPEFQEKVDPETVRKYFQDCIAFAERHLGVVINARSHVDEATFHLHIQTVPLVEKEDGSFRLSAKILMGGREDYCRRQDLFFTEVAEAYGFDKCVKQEDRVEKRQHYDSLEYKCMMREQELEKVTAELEDKTEDLERTKTEIQEKTEQLESVNTELKQKTGVLEWTFDKIGTICKTIYKYSSIVSRYLVGMVGEFIEKVSAKRHLTPYDFEIAYMKTEKVSPSAGSDPLVLPVTQDGTRLSWSGSSPVYDAADPDYLVPYGSIDNETGVIETEDNFEWSEKFPEDGCDDFIDPNEVEYDNAAFELQNLKNEIGECLGKDTDVDSVQDIFDNMDSPTEPDPDDIAEDNPDKIDDIGQD